MGKTLKPYSRSSYVLATKLFSPIEENLKAVELELTPHVISETEKILSSIRHFEPLR